MAGFLWKYNLSGGRPLIFEFTMASTETLTVGDLLNLQTGEADLAVTNDALLFGPVQGALDPADNVAGSPGQVSGTAATTVILAIVNADAVLGDDADANARVVGVNLDLAGATGAQGVAAAVNNDLFVVKDSAAAEDTIVKVAEGEHMYDQA